MNISEPTSTPVVANNKQKKNEMTIDVLLENIAKLENIDYPNWRAIVKLQSELIRLMSVALKDQNNEYKKINDKITAMETRLKTETIPVNDMQKLADILKPFLAKTYQNNKQVFQTQPSSIL